MEDFEAQTGVNTPVQPAAEPTGDTGQLATGQGVTEPQPAPETQPVPYERFREVNEAKKAAEQRAANLETQFMLLQQAQQVAAPAQAGQSDIFDTPGEDYEPITRAEARKIVERTERKAEQRTAAVQQMSAREQFIKSKPDYETLVGTVDFAGRFVPSEHFQKVVAADPELAYECSNPLTGPRIAYRAAKAFKAEQDLAQARQQSNQRDINQQVNLRTNPLPASAVGGGGAIQRGSELLGLDPANPADREKILALTERTTRR